MPRIGSVLGTVFPKPTQAAYFASGRVLKQTTTDAKGRAWTLVAGDADDELRNYGFFDGDDLIAFVRIASPEVTADDCPTVFWSVGKIEVLDAYQQQGIGSGLIAAVMKEHGAPLASDLDLSPAAAAMWRSHIVANPGRVELHDENGLIGIVKVLGGALHPDPWAKRETRLVRRS